jgi:uncharacterized repeat protein (TIGR01451 family)
MNTQRDAAPGSNSQYRNVRMAGRLALLKRVPSLPSNSVVSLIRYGVLTILITLIASGSFSPPSSSSSLSHLGKGELNATPAPLQRVMPGRLYVSSARKTQKAQIATDKSDYAPGEKVIITGSGWKPGEMVRLAVKRNTGASGEVFLVRANSAGRIQHTELLIKKSDLGVSFVLTATGLSSRYTAEIKFTDGNITIKPAYEGQTNAGGLQTFTITKQIFTGSTNCSSCGSAPITVTGVNATTGHTFALADTESALISTVPFSEQNGPFGSGWFSPTGSLFTTDPSSNLKICIPGTQTGTYVAPFKPGLVTLDSTCMSPKTTFNLGETICVKVFGDPALTPFACNPMPKYFQIQLEDPFAAVRNCTGPCATDTSIRVLMDQGTYSFVLPATNGPAGMDNRGPWSARVLDCLGNGLGRFTFLLRNPNAGEQVANLQVSKSDLPGGGPVPPNGTIQYDIFVSNVGPDPAQTVSFTDAVPTNTTFLSFQQLSGPVFTIMTPAVGGTGNVTGTIATLPPGIANGTALPPETAVFRMAVKVNNVAGDGSVVITNSVSVSSTTTDLQSANNMSTTANPIQSSACSLTCGSDITMAANAVCNTPPGSCGPGTVVTFSNATPTGTCGAVTCAPPSGSCFPVGTTNVVCQENNARCIFRVTIDPIDCTVACPANQSVSNTPGQCGATVKYPAPTESGSACGGTITCNPPSGSVFPVGTTSVNCSDSAGPGCSFTVTVNDTQPPTIACPSNITVFDVACQNVSYTTPTPGDNCPGATVTCAPASGSCFPVGTTTVTCTATDASNNTATCSFTVTVNDCVITCPANITTSNDPNQCGAVVTFAPTTSGACGTVKCTPASGSFFLVGTTTVTCTASAGPSCSFTVTVNDTQPPSITCPPNQTAVTNQSVCPNTACQVVAFPAPVASDNCPGVVVVCNPPSGSCFPVGVTTVTCTATDSSNNTATCSFTVTTFDTALQDDSNPSNILLWNSLSGAYRFCCNGTTFTGLGKVFRQGCVYTLDHTFASDRRVLGRVDKTARAGSASLQSPAGTTRCTIIDRNILNDTNLTSCK